MQLSHIVCELTESCFIGITVLKLSARGIFFCDLQQK